MIKAALKNLAIAVFGLIASGTVLGIPLMLWVGPVMERNPSLDLPAFLPGDIWPITALLTFGLAVLAFLLFVIAPAIVDVFRAIWHSRDNANGDMFP